MQTHTNYTFIAFIFLTLGLGANSAFAEKVLTAAEAKALFTGKTFDGTNVKKGKAYQVYSNADGTMLHKNKKRTKEFKWHIDEAGQHCAVFKKGPRCGNIIDMGNGVYHKVRDGKHINTLTNFVEGNQLN